MNDKLVSLNAVLALLNATSQDEITDECYDRLYNAVANMDAAPHEMSAREFVRAKNRICAAMVFCADCPYKSYCTGAKVDAEEEVAIVEAWAKEHPEVNDE